LRLRRFRAQELRNRRPDVGKAASRKRQRHAPHQRYVNPDPPHRIDFYLQTRFLNRHAGSVHNRGIVIVVTRRSSECEAATKSTLNWADALPHMCRRIEPAASRA
jgi:hypothetical protein